MRGLSFLIFGCILLGAPVLPAGFARAEQCGARYDAAFSRLSSLGLRGLSQDRATAEVNSLFGPRPDTCETGGYQHFIDGFINYAREAINAPVRQRDGMVRVAVAAAGQGPLRVVYAESKGAVTLYRQARSDLHAIADDVGISPQIQVLLDSFDRVGPPQSLPPPPSSPPASGDNTQAIRVPTTPLPPWAVIGLYEVKDMLRRQDHAGAQAKLDQILKWLETAP